MPLKKATHLAKMELCLPLTRTMWSMISKSSTSKKSRNKCARTQNWKVKARRSSTDKTSTRWDRINNKGDLKRLQVSNLPLVQWSLASLCPYPKRLMILLYHRSSPPRRQWPLTIWTSKSTTLKPKHKSKAWIMPTRIWESTTTTIKSSTSLLRAMRLRSNRLFLVRTMLRAKKRREPRQ